MKTEAIRIARQGRRLPPERRETGSVTGVKSVAPGTRQTRDRRTQEGEPIAEEEYTGEREAVEDERDVTMTETAGETEMGAAASND